MGAEPAVREDIANRARGGFVALPSGRGVGLDDVVVLQMPLVEGVGRAGEQRRAYGVAFEKRRKSPKKPALRSRAPLG